jgi:uncharacterized MAPEG superfamily protein
VTSAKLPYVLLFLAFVLIYVPRVLVIVFSVKTFGRLDNNNPRDQQAQLTGWGKRAQGAHMNMIEAFPVFAAGMLSSMIGHVPLERIVYLGAAFIALRVIYIGLYLGDQASARSAVWMLATGIAAALIVMPVL